MVGRTAGPSLMHCLVEHSRVRPNLLLSGRLKVFTLLIWAARSSMLGVIYTRVIVSLAGT